MIGPADARFLTQMPEPIIPFEFYDQVRLPLGFAHSSSARACLPRHRKPPLSATRSSFEPSPLSINTSCSTSSTYCTSLPTIRTKIS